MKKLLLVITALLLISCNEISKTEFSLIGTTHKMENGTMLYLEVEKNLIDSTKIENNTFTFTTDLSEANY